MSESRQMLETAIKLAADAHAGQTDRGGQPYILHPLWVMQRGQSVEEMIVGVLHDVIEDTSVTEAQIAVMFGEEIAAAVSALTKRDGEDYQSFIVRCCTNETARRVKLRDLEHNSDLSRLSKVTNADLKRLDRYNEARGYLMRKGANP